METVRNFFRGSNKLSKIRCHVLRDNNNVRIVEYELEREFIIYRWNNSYKRAWMHMYKLLKMFWGFRNINRGMVAVIMERDICYDPFDQLSDDEKPDENMKLGKRSQWLSRIVNNQCRLRQEQAEKKLAFTTQIALLSIPVLLIFVAVFIVVLINMN